MNCDDDDDDDKVTIRPAFSRTVLYFRDLSRNELCPGFVRDLKFCDFSLENAGNSFH